MKVQAVRQNREEQLLREGNMIALGMHHGATEKVWRRMFPMTFSESVFPEYDQLLARFDQLQVSM